MIYYIIIGGFLLLSWAVGHRLKKKFALYAKTPTSSGMSGAEIAQRMLSDHGIGGVQITCVPGQLTDHYDPRKKTVNLSEEVYHGRHVSAAAVAAHECGHAVQHARAYAMLGFRSAMVPVVQLSSKLMRIFFFVAIFSSLAVNLFPMHYAIYGIVAVNFVFTLFALVTLPVEFDASNRALAWLNKSAITRGIEHDQAKDALKWAASTYVVSALAALAQLAYWLLMLTGRRD